MQFLFASRNDEKQASQALTIKILKMYVLLQMLALHAAWMEKAFEMQSVFSFSIVVPEIPKAIHLRPQPSCHVSYSLHDWRKTNHATKKAYYSTRFQFKKFKYQRQLSVFDSVSNEYVFLMLRLNFYV